MVVWRLDREAGKKVKVPKERERREYKEEGRVRVLSRGTLALVRSRKEGRAG